jgi:hypothetical protein
VPLIDPLEEQGYTDTGLSVKQPSHHYVDTTYSGDHGVSHIDEELHNDSAAANPNPSSPNPNPTIAALPRQKTLLKSNKGFQQRVTANRDIHHTYAQKGTEGDIDEHRQKAQATRNSDDDEEEEEDSSEYASSSSIESWGDEPVSIGFHVVNSLYGILCIIVTPGSTY